MLSLRTLITAMVGLNILVTLPTATRCDTSYYEKYYSARRFIPPKRAALVEYTFTVHLAGESLANYESVALTGDLKQLGRWLPEKAVHLNRTDEYNVWSGKVQLPMNISVNYRYFIAAVSNATGVVQVRRWESHILPRHFDVAVLSGNRTDKFGWIKIDQREVKRGWLTPTNKIIQFKLFRNPFHINEGLLHGKESLNVRLQPIEPIFLTPLLPSSRVHSEYVRMAYGNSFIRDQPEFGVPYEKDDILIFHTTGTALEEIAYLLKIYATEANTESVRLIGYQYIYPHALQGSEGKFNVNLISPVWLNSIGSVDLEYLVISPLSDSSAVNFRTTFVDYWRSNWTRLDVGHRGLGKSLTQTTNTPPIIENTVASMKAAANLGTDMVEFDVMLTSDHIPIINHDYVVYVCMDPKKPTSKDDLTPVYIKDVTYEQLKNLKTYQVVGAKIIEYPAHNSVKNEDHRLFPSFEDFLTKINKTVGFDIEIKWPQLKANGQYESNQTIDKNIYVDRILDVMFRHGCGRLSFFTSFDADICTLLRFKQNMYPVMFLSSYKERIYADPRSDTIYDSVNNAQAFDLAGIVPNAIHIHLNPKWIDIAKKQHKKVFLWGDAIKDTTSIAWFKDQGPEGVIYDRLDLWLSPDKQNAFEMESDLSEFFQMQCDPNKATENVNSTTESPLANVNFLK